MRFLVTVFFVFCAVQAQALNIQQVSSPKLGVQALLVESQSIPMVNIQVAFRAGSAFDPQGKGGLAHLTGALFDEGAGDLDSKAYTESLERIGALFSVNPGLLNTTFSMRTLSDKKEEAFKLLGMAISQPRFDKEAFKRMQDATLSAIKSAQQNPGSIANLLLRENLYINHPYGQPTNGIQTVVENLSVLDVQNFYKANFTRRNMVVSVVGDITKAELENYLDLLFENLPQGQGRQQVAQAPEAITPVIIRETRAVPQSTVYLAHLGINREDKDYYAAYAMNYILGGGGFNSRLMEEIREKRGLAYGVSSYFEPLPHKGAFIASVSTKNKDVQTAISLIKKEIARLKKKGVTDEEYAGAMSFLKGSFPLRLDSSSKVLGYLTTMQMENLGLDYLDKWTKRIESVSKEDMQRVAKRLLHENEMITVIVGGEE
tara:strand:- start:124825 stop:126117 length:1293 start_codon:yes stop_codon:yes gene_type:complete